MELNGYLRLEGGVRGGEECLKGIEFQFCKMEKFWRSVSKHCEYTEHLKMVKTVNFLCLPQEKKGSVFKIILISLFWVMHQQAIKFKIQVNVRIFIYEPQSLVQWIFTDIIKHASSVLVPTTMFQTVSFLKKTHD